MQQRLKERLVGAAVLVVIAVIFIPMLLTGPVDSGSITKTNIPDRPLDKFEPKLVPISESLKPLPTDNSGAVENSVVTETTNSEQVIAVDTAVAEGMDEPGAETTPDSVTTKPVQDSTALAKDKQVGLSAWVVQLGSFSSKVNADKLNLTLRKAGFPAFVEPITKNKETAYRVRVGPELLRSDADTLLKNIKAKMKLDGIVLSYP